MMKKDIEVREKVMKMIDVMNYVIVYFEGEILIEEEEEMRMMIKFDVWIVEYIVMMRILIKSLRVV